MADTNYVEKGAPNLVVTKDPAGVSYKEVAGNNPQNGYRSYDPERIFLDDKSWNNDRVSHERLSHYQVIDRANGGGPDDRSAVGKFVDDTNL